MYKVLKMRPASWDSLTNMLKVRLEFHTLVTPPVFLSIYV